MGLKITNIRRPENRLGERRQLYPYAAIIPDRRKGKDRRASAAKINNNVKIAA